MSNKPDQEGFLNRWSGRKKRAAQTIPADGAASDTAGGSDVAMLVQSELSEQTSEISELTPAVGTDSVPTVSTEVSILTDADMPAVETLTSKSDLSDFFSSGVSATLRKAALRHVFHQPVYNIRDGLDDYDDDYTIFEPLGDTVTSDMKFHAARKERNRLVAEQADNERDAASLAPAENESTEQVAVHAEQENQESINQDNLIEHDDLERDASAVPDKQAEADSVIADAGVNGVDETDLNDVLPIEPKHTENSA